MCDYSLNLVASRPAKVGDKLLTTKFQDSMTRGFAAIGEPNVAVCLLPGTEIAFEKEVKYERIWRLGRICDPEVSKQFSRSVGDLRHSSAHHERCSALAFKPTSPG
jgi:hypothetical protein